MERNLDRKTLSFGKGMTNVPSDLLSDDTELLESDGFIYKDGEMKPIQEPIRIGSVEGKLMLVHKMADYENLISYDGTSLYWYKKRSDGTIGSKSGSFTIGSVNGINAIGNTIIVATSEGLHYIKFKSGLYKDLGTELPKPKVYPYFGNQGNLDVSPYTPCVLEGIIDSTRKQAVYDTSGRLTGIKDASSNPFEIIDGAYYQYSPKSEESKTIDFKNAVQGHIANVIEKVKEKNRFAFPFFLRYALKLYDGTYARISAPILMCPTISRNCFFVPVVWDENTKMYKQTPEKTSMFAYRPYCGSIYFNATIEGMENWSDIVKELVVFASDDVMPFYIDGEYSFTRATDADGEDFVNFIGSRVIKGDGILFPEDMKMWTFSFSKTLFPARDVILPKYKSEKEIISDLLSKTQFFKLFSVKATDSYYIQNLERREAPIGRLVVKNLLTQEQLKTDDYYGWADIVANKMSTYNKRVNLFDIKRFPFNGFNVFSNYDVINENNSGNNNSYSYYVHIVSDGMDRWVESDILKLSIPDVINAWFFYPDANATEAVVWDNVSEKGMKLSLEVHPMLNGAYSFNKLPTEDTFVADNTVRKPSVDSDLFEKIDSQIFTSVVNDPFVFEASGDNTVGTGRIIGIAANTEPVSTGQFGQYPLIVFTDEGIYGMSVNSEGLYSSIYPISRECCEENSPIVPTGNAVYFTSSKGLMAVSGNTVVCLSSQLRGKNTNAFSRTSGLFTNFLKGCFIAYDYRDSMLRICSEAETYQYVFNMIDKTFSVVSKAPATKSVVGNYPDNLIQGTDGSVYSLSNKLDINADKLVSYSGTIITRPLKLGGSTTLKSLRGIKHIFDSEKGKLFLEVYGSNDCKNWCKLNSMMGKPWKYFTFKYTLSGFSATDSFAGSIVEVQPRREDKIR